MMIDHIRRYVLPAAFALLPPGWGSPQAAALLLAIGLQESRFEYRRQINGPARGFWQFEVAGVRGVLQHPATKVAVADAVDALRFGTLQPAQLQALLETNDTLAAVCARALLYTVPAQPGALDHQAAGWHAYLSGWRPGRPRLETWAGNYTDAWTVTNT